MSHFVLFNLILAGTGVFVGCLGMFVLNDKGALWAGVIVTCISIVLIIGWAAINALRYFMGWV